MKPLDDSLLIDLESLPLSKSECSVAKLLAWGYTQKEIAYRLFISPLTVNTHLKNIYRKLSIRKETDLTRWWIFHEYAIADNPLKKIIGIFFFLISLSLIFNENPAVRIFRVRNIRPIEIYERTTRIRRYENVFDLSLQLTT